jgi:hypothetical protein
MFATIEAEEATEAAAPSTQTDDVTSTEEASWESLVEGLLRRAATVAGEHGADLDQFMNAAFGVFLDTQPGLRARLAEARMLAELEGMRNAGLIGSA